MKKSTKFATFAAATAALGFGFTGIAAAAHGGASTDGYFSGRAEIDSSATNNRIVGDPNGRGYAEVSSPGGGVVCFELYVSKIATPTAAHIHEATAGSNGPVVVTLAPPVNGYSEGCVDTGDADLAADIVLRESSEYYVNVHNAEFPGGAVRAQLGN
ncbi:MAG: CHRD domain-containing protein [Acidimicrobiales bacterium]|nr:CHRD domain-containing protein [Acidimicrobiales bacterium]